MNLSTNVNRILCAVLTTVAIFLAGCSNHSGGLVPSTQSNAASHKLKPFDASGSFEQMVLQDHPTQYFELEDTSCCTATNIGSSGASGTYTSSGIAYSLAGPLQGETSTAIGLPGHTSTAAISIGVSLPNPSTSGAFTVEDWVFPTFTSTNNNVNSYYAIWGYNGSHRLLVNNQSGAKGQLLAQLGGISFKSTKALAANAWNQVVFVYDGKNEYFYINGALDSSQAVTGVSLTSTYWLGQYDASDFYKFNGRMGQHMVFQGALSASVIQNHYTAGTTGGGSTPTPTPTPGATPTPTSTPIAGGDYPSVVLGDGPAAYYHLDDSGTMANDASGHAHTGTVGSSVTTGVAGLVPSFSDQSMTFPGSASAAGVVNVPQSTSLQPASTLTLEAWISFPATPATYTFVTGYGSDTSYAPYALFFRTGGQIVAQFYLTSGVLEVPSSLTLAANKTYHVVSTFDGTTGRIYVNGMQTGSVAKTGTIGDYFAGYGFSIGDDAAKSDPAFKGTVDEVAIYTNVLSAAQIQNHYTVGTTGGGATPTPTTAPTPTPSGPATDWLSFGYDLQRSGYNPNETTVGTGNVGALQKVWVFNVGSSPVHEPVYATNVNVNGVSTNVIYAGSNFGSTMYAVNAATGAIVWQDPVPFATYSCGGSHSQFSIGETPAIDRGKNRLYFADGQNQVHAVDLATGTEASGWPITIADYTPDHNFMHGGLTYNPSNGLLYAVTGSTCDISPWYGRIVAINTNGPSVAGTFFTMSGTSSQGASGGGVWGPGGGSIVPTNNNVAIAVGNADTTSGASQHSGFAEQIIELSPTLSTVVANNYPTNIPVIGGDNDFDFGATPLVFQPPGCPLMLAAENKSGMFELYDESTLSSGPIQYIAMSVPSDSALFIGTPAYDPATNLVYVGMPTTSGIYQPGLAAFSITSNCTLNTTPVWSAQFGPDGPRRSPISIANGVVYVGNYTGDTLYAFNAATGAQLWSVALSSYTGVGTVIANGMVYIGAQDGTITAYAPPAAAQILKKAVVKTSRSFVPVHHGVPRTTFSWERWP